MRKTFSPALLALCVLFLMGLYGCSASGQGSLATGNIPGVQANQQPAVGTTAHPNGLVQDWSTQSLLFPRVGEIHALMALQNDPRATQSWQAAARQDFRRTRTPLRFLNIESAIHTDWSISLGTGGVANSMFPAKFSFSTSAAPSCANDFVVFPVNVAGSATQPNIVAFNNLYSGTTPSNGICNRAINPPIDDGVSGTTMWSYDITAGGGVVATSPALSLDGTKIAFVETGSGTAAHLHVLAWKSGDGVNAGNLQSVTSPAVITSGFSANAPAAGSGTVTDLSFGAANDTLSSPFIDYTNDLAYVGNDAGVLFRFKNVFCTTAACTGGGSPAPSLDTSWGSSGSVNVCAGKLTGPVVDGGTGHVFVGCADGKVYGFTAAGAALTNPSVTVGNGTATGGVVDPPMVDAVNHFIYAVAGASAGGTSVLVQASSVDLSSAVTATFGAGGAHPLHSPAFDNPYFTSIDHTQWLIYEWALNAGGTGITLYGVTFNTSHGMTSGAATDSLNVGGSTPVEFSPLTQFFDGTNDQVFVSGITNVTPNFVEYNMQKFLPHFPNSFPPGANGATTSQSGGTSGMVVDNNSAQNQASSIYFGTLTSNNAVKLTQQGLQ